MLQRSRCSAISYGRQCALDILYRHFVLRNMCHSCSCRRRSQFFKSTTVLFPNPVRSFSTSQWPGLPATTLLLNAPVAHASRRLPALADTIKPEEYGASTHTADDVSLKYVLPSKRVKLVASTDVDQEKPAFFPSEKRKKAFAGKKPREGFDSVFPDIAVKNGKLAAVNAKLSEDNDDVTNPELVVMQEAHVLRHSRFLLRSFLHVCGETGLANRAYHHVQRVRKIASPAGLAGKPDLRIYNTLLRACAKQGDNARVYEVTRWIAEDGLIPDVYTFAHWLECVGRDALRAVAAGGIAEKERDAVRITLEQMERYHLKPLDLFHRCKFVYDEREMILHAVRLVKPEFDPVIGARVFKDNYQTPLLTLLNEKNFRVQHAVPEPLESPYAGLFTREALMASLDKQMQIEATGRLEIRSIFQDQPHMRLHESEQARLDVESNTWQQRVQRELEEDSKAQSKQRQLQHYRAMFNKMKSDWHDALTSYLTRERNFIINAPHVSRKPSVDPYLLALSPEQLAQVLVDELVQIGSFSPNYSPGLFTLEHQLGAIVMRRFMMQLKRKCGVWHAIQYVSTKYFDHLLESSANDACNHRQYWLKLCREIGAGASPSMANLDWPREVKFELGRRLYEILIEANVIMVNDNLFRKRASEDAANFLPAVFTIHRRNASGTLTVQVKPNPKLAKLIKLSQAEFLTFDVNACPMVSPPQPWTAQTAGGYLLAPTVLTRVPEQARLVRSVVDMARPRSLYAVFDALNILGASPWKVNTEMLDLLVGIFNHGGMPEMDIPSPASSELVSPKFNENMTPEQQRRLLQKEKAEMHSLWCNALYKLSIAQHLRDEVFFLPHTLDFRGRVYPVAPHLSQMGDDSTRSLMLFAKGRPLGPHGFDWLKIHCINLTSFKKKASTHDRLRYANEQMSEILDSADRPLTGRGWWKTSDDPWQTLACCKEIRNVIRSGVPPEQYVCHFPVHQDGSCNGLQHYAALGRDKQGAESVNLCLNTTPQDVYSNVAALVEAKRAADAADNNAVAEALAGFVQRKVVKQTVMTIVYGVTRFGAREQIYRQLTDLPGFPQEFASRAAQYLAQATFASIGEIFHSARQIQDWLTHSAREIARTHGMPVEWRTPLGLPVSQPYFKYAVPNYNTSRAFASVKQACSYKQANAMPPNFIHSLDSTHMMLTALYCHRANLSFVSVHDSFWTHPSTVEPMGRILREQFVALHENPLLENLSRNFVEQYGITDVPDYIKGVRDDEKPKKRGKLSDAMKKLTPAERKLYAQHAFNRLLSDVPAKGKFDLRQVLDSEFFFS